MSIELAGPVREFTPKELEIEEKEWQKKKSKTTPVEKPLAQMEMPQYCPSCGTFSAGADVCPNCEQIIEIGSKNNTEPSS
jgi:rubrerythrin